MRRLARGWVAWRGTNSLSKRVGASIRVYTTVWENPKPNTKVVNIDYATMKTIAAPFCVAMTVEEPFTDSANKPTALEPAGANADCQPE